MSSVWNNRISVSLFGEAHSNVIGVTVNNLPAGEYIDAEEIDRFMSRINRKKESMDFLRKESVVPHIISGVYNERTTGAPLSALIQNSVSETDGFSSLGRLARPGHADYTGAVRYRGFNDVRDSGHFSERLTVPLCFAGAVCGQILERRGIYTGSHIAQVHTVKDNPFDYVNLRRDHIISMREKEFPVINDRKGWIMARRIMNAHQEGDSLGGVIECASVNIPAGIGSPVFNGMQSTISQLIFSIPNVTGIEFGAGFKASRMTGSENNDEFYVDEHGHVLTKTNNHGGILGGISSGMPIVFRVSFKPDPSVAKPQETVDLHTMSKETFSLDDCETCTFIKAVPCVEAVADIALLSHMMDYPNFC